MGKQVHGQQKIPSAASFTKSPDRAPATKGRGRAGSVEEREEVIWISLPLVDQLIVKRIPRLAFHNV